MLHGDSNGTRTKHCNKERKIKALFCIGSLKYADSTNPNIETNAMIRHAIVAIKTSTVFTLTSMIKTVYIIASTKNKISMEN